MLPREYLPHRGQEARPARHSFRFRALGLATAALLLTSCSPAVFQPASVQAEGIQAAPAFDEGRQTSSESDSPDDDAQPAVSAAQQGAEAVEQNAGTAAEAPLPALAAEVKNSRDAQREAAADGVAALSEARERHQAQLDAEAEQLAREQAEAEEEAEREQQRQEDAAEESAEESAEDEEPTQPETPAQPTPDPDEPAPEGPDDFPTFTGDLDTYLGELAESHPGDISISVTELGGQGRSGSTAGSESRVSASTYKLFVAYGILERVESGELDWDDPVDGGRDRETCFNDMITVSDNPCADVFRDEIGWRGLRDIAAETGGPTTDFIPSYTRTSTNDLTAFLARLETGSLNLSAESRSRLLGALEGNIYRAGVPAGSAGAVLNKVGFIQGYLNDAAIVRHPQGTYVISILSDGSDWESIASITRQVEAALY
ncbi:serine hydrolase [Nesterenkonia lutea]|uniref:Beta-lactamase class A n=1 Tax=Nesterenkonia lutea TaxID=272919 RepID=A0ABR9JCC8_9MICC|nr:serine hydrolase [Nesterenkonia lutea]MBE1523596.1 beta-lactamase class A [Nesterenkonia lutea]